MEELRQRAKWVQLRKSLSRLGTYVLMSFLGFLFLFPIIFMVVAAFKPNERVIADLDSVQAFIPNPSILTFDNVQDVFARVPFDQYVTNSLLITLVTVIVGIFMNSMAAFVLARMRWFGRNVTLGIIVSLIIIPLEAIAVPLMMRVNDLPPLITYLILGILIWMTVLIWSVMWNILGKWFEDTPRLIGIPKPINMLIRAALTLMLSFPLELLIYYLGQQISEGGTWLNSYHVQILPFIAEPFSIFLFYQFFISIPKDFDEAAFVDGASYFQIYWRIMVPLSRPVIATVAILKFLQFWSFYLWPLMVTRSDDYRPLMVGMDFFQTQQPIRWGSIMAYAALVTIPVLIVFLLFQKWFVQSVSSSGVKG